MRTFREKLASVVAKGKMNEKLRMSFPLDSCSLSVFNELFSALPEVKFDETRLPNPVKHHRRHASACFRTVRRGFLSPELNAMCALETVARRGQVAQGASLKYSTGSTTVFVGELVAVFDSCDQRLRRHKVQVLVTVLALNMCGNIIWPKKFKKVFCPEEIGCVERAIREQ